MLHVQNQIQICSKMSEKNLTLRKDFWKPHPWRMWRKRSQKVDTRWYQALWDNIWWARTYYNSVRYGNKNGDQADKRVLFIGLDRSRLNLDRFDLLIMNTTRHRYKKQTWMLAVGICSAIARLLLSKLSSSAISAPWTPDSMRLLANSFRPIDWTHWMTRSLDQTNTSTQLTTHKWLHFIDV